MQIDIDGHLFAGRFEEGRSPANCAAFRAAMPFSSRIVHVRWSGKAVWIPLGELDFGVGFEDTTSYPAPGQVLFYRRARARPRS